MAFVDTGTLSEVFDLLRHPHRRYVIYSLQETQRRLDTATLAKGIAAWETDDRAVSPNEFDTDAVMASLHHTHLPRLAEAGLLDYDETRDCVELCGHIVTDGGLDDKLRVERCSVLRSER